MMLRSPLKSKQDLAENGDAAHLCFAGEHLRVTIMQTMQTGRMLVRISSQHHAPSYDGQQASPSAKLPVLFGFNWAMAVGRERIAAARVVILNKIKKGLRAWGTLNSFSHLQQLLVFRPVATQSHSKPLLARLWAQALLLLPAARFCKVQSLALGQLLSRAKPNWSTVTNQTIGRIASFYSNVLTPQVMRQRGVLRCHTPFKIQKGLAYV